MLKRIAFLLALAPFATFADDIAPPAAPALPVINDTLRAAYWRSQVDVAQLAQREGEIRRATEAVVAQLRAACGVFTLTDRPDGEPHCVAPAPTAAAIDPGKPWFIHDDKGNVMGPHPSQDKCMMGAIQFGLVHFTCTQGET